MRIAGRGRLRPKPLGDLVDQRVGRRRFRMGSHKAVGQSPGRAAGERPGQRGGGELRVLQGCTVHGGGACFRAEQQGRADLHGVRTGGAQRPGLARRGNAAGRYQFNAGSQPGPGLLHQLRQRLGCRFGGRVEAAAVSPGVGALQAEHAGTGGGGQFGFGNRGDRDRNGRSGVGQGGKHRRGRQPEGKGHHRHPQPVHQLQFGVPAVGIGRVRQRQQVGRILPRQLPAVGQGGSQVSGRAVPGHSVPGWHRAGCVGNVRHKEVDPERAASSPAGKVPGGGDLGFQRFGGFVAGGQEAQSAGVGHRCGQRRGGGAAGHGSPHHGMVE